MDTELLQRCFFVLGPTAVGKTEAAVAMAERIGGEVIGADAYQVYDGLDILSAKPAPGQLARVRHHLVGEVPLACAFDVAQYRAMALPRIQEVVSRGRVPVVCGGTGLYVRALTHGLAEMPQADPSIRAELEQQPLTELVRRLRELDPDSRVDEKNPRRVIRALEVCMVSGQPFSSFRREWEQEPPVRGVVLSRSRETLLQRIESRTEALFKDGVVEEVRAAGEVGSTAGQMLGLREIRALIAGEISAVECRESIAVATRQYAKRQVTWFRRERGYMWVDADETGDLSATLLREWEKL